MPTREADVDVLVAGAGPAGSLAALILARAGLRVRILDRAVFPRPKLCGDTLNPGALAILRRWGLLDAVAREGRPLEGMIVSGPGGVQVQGRYPPGVTGLSIARTDFDWIVLQQAIAAGAAFQPRTRVRGPLLDARGRVAGLETASVAGTPEHAGAPLTIAADGRRSALALAMGLARQPRRPRRWAIGACFDRGALDARFGEMHIRRAGYVGVVARPDGLTNACLVVSAPRAGLLARPRALLEATLRADPLIGPRFHRARMAGDPVVLGPLAVDARAAGADGLLLAGDAAGFIDPMTGDGLRFALRGAELAAAAAIDALEGRVRNPAQELAVRRRDAFGGKWRLNRSLRRLIDLPFAVSAAAAAARVHPAAVRRLIVAAADIPCE